MSSLVRAALLTAALTVLAACAGAPAGPPASPSPSPSPSASPPPSAAPGPDGPVVVTIRVADAEEFRVLLTDPDDIAIARELLAGREAPSIPNGRIVRGDPGVNTGYSWHLDPDDFEWADMTIEVCDGRPSDVERVITSDRYCTWAGTVVAVEPAG